MTATPDERIFSYGNSARDSYTLHHSAYVDSTFLESEMRVVFSGT